MTKRGLHAAFLLALAALSACTENTPTGDLQLFAFEESHMGTLFRLKLYAHTEQEARTAATDAFNRIDQLDQSLSDYLPESELSKINGSAPASTPIPVSPDLFRVLSTAKELAHSSKGAFDPTIGYATNLWRRSLRKQTLPSAKQLADARAKTGADKFSLGSREDPNEPTPTLTLAVPGIHFDLGGIAKGYAADEALARLAAHRITRAAVAAGGDIRVGDPPPNESHWEIPILGMNRTSESVTATLHLANTAVSTSGDREQFVEIDDTQYSHIVDPRTGLGLTRRVTATVIAPNATHADALATALCILAPEKGIALIEKTPHTEALIITADNNGNQTRHATSGFPPPRL